MWVSPWDIRPDFADLQRAANLGAYAFLLEARTVLGQSGRALAAAAWNFPQLHAAQSWLLASLEATRRVLSDSAWSIDRWLALLREQQAAYLAVMADDPLWPLELYPGDYLGPRLFRAHQALAGQMIRRLPAFTGSYTRRSGRII